jgi:hypothetical protein
MNDWEKKYMELAQAIHDGVPYGDLTRMVGASDEENEQARIRLERLDALTPLCNWGAPAPNTEERQARESYRRVLAVQDHFESKYF